jgi:hypothetical protein
VISHYNGNAKRAKLRDRLWMLLAETDTAPVEAVLASVAISWGLWFLTVPGILDKAPVYKFMAKTLHCQWAWGLSFLVYGIVRAVVLLRVDTSHRKRVSFWGSALWLYVLWGMATSSVASAAVPTTFVFAVTSAWIYWRLPCRKTYSPR